MLKSFEHPAFSFWYLTEERNGTVKAYSLAAALRRRTRAATPAKPVPSRIIVAGSGIAPPVTVPCKLVTPRLTDGGTRRKDCVML